MGIMSEWQRERDSRPQQVAQWMNWAMWITFTNVSDGTNVIRVLSRSCSEQTAHTSFALMRIMFANVGDFNCAVKSQNHSTNVNHVLTVLCVQCSWNHSESESVVVHWAILVVRSQWTNHKSRLLRHRQQSLPARTLAASFAEDSQVSHGSSTLGQHACGWAQLNWERNESVHEVILFSSFTQKMCSFEWHFRDRHNTKVSKNCFCVLTTSRLTVSPT